MELQIFLDEGPVFRHVSTYQESPSSCSVCTLPLSFTAAACVQSANKTPGIAHVYRTLNTLWKHFHNSPKRAEHLKEVQSVLEPPEMKVIKPTDTRWLSHERCVKAVKASYSAIVITIGQIYETTHEPEALGIHGALCKLSTIAAIYLLDFTLPQVAKLSKGLQTEQHDLSLISSLVDTTVQSLDDAVLPGANWMLELLDNIDDLKTATKVTIDADKIIQNTIAKPFDANLKANIISRFASSNAVVSAVYIQPTESSKIRFSITAHLRRRVCWEANCPLWRR